MEKESYSGHNSVLQRLLPNLVAGLSAGHSKEHQRLKRNYSGDR